LSSPPHPCSRPHLGNLSSSLKFVPNPSCRHKHHLNTSTVLDLLVRLKLRTAPLLHDLLPQSRTSNQTALDTPEIIGPCTSYKLRRALLVRAGSFGQASQPAVSVQQGPNSITLTWDLVLLS